METETAEPGVTGSPDNSVAVPANVKRLLESLQQAKSGDRHEHELAE
jgi:hypothetical protein